MVNNIKNVDNLNDFSKYYKQYIDIFKELNLYLYYSLFPEYNYDKKKYDFISDNLAFGKKLLDWIIGDDKFPKKELERFYDNLKNNTINKDIHIFEMRWEAMEEYFTGNISKAQNIYDSILKDINNVDDIVDIYLKDDILIDSRNINYQLKDIKKGDEIQNIISSQKYMLANPAFDRIENRIYSIVHRNIFNIKNKNKYTVIYGLGLAEVLNKIQDLAFLTIVYGSITFLNKVRGILAKVFYLYADALNYEKLYMLSLKFYALNNDSKKFKKLFDVLKVNINSLYDKDFINLMINQKEYVLEYNKDNYIYGIFKVYGRYMDEKKFENYENIILNGLEKNLTSCTDYPTALLLFDSINNNMWRIHNIEKLLNIILQYLDKKYTDFYKPISNVLNSIDVNNLKDEEYGLLKNVINKVLDINDSMLNIGLLMINCKIHDSKSTEYDKYIFNNQSNELLYYIISGENVYKSTEMIINIEKERFNESRKGMMIGYSQEYTLGENIFEKSNFTDEMKKLIDTNYLPLCNNVLSSESQTITNKIKFLKTLAYLLLENFNDYNTIVSKTISNLNYNSKSFEEFNPKNEMDLKINEYMVKFLLNQIDSNQLIDCYISIILINEKNILEALKCFEILKDKLVITEIKNDELYSIFEYCYNKNDDIEVKSKSYSILRLLLRTNNKDKAIKLLESNSQKCSFEEAYSIIRILKFENIEEIYKESIKNSLLKNPNYYVRIITDKNL